METIWTLGHATHRGLWLETWPADSGYAWRVLDLHHPAPLAIGCASTWPDARDAAVVAADELAPAHWEADRNLGEMLMLAVSELAEALEEHRAGRGVYYHQHRQPCPAQGDGLGIPADQLGACSGAPLCKPEGVAVEMADCLIRVLDTMYSLGVDIDAVVEEKMAYNAARPFKHGKAY